MAQTPREEILLPKLLDAVLPYYSSVYVTALNIIQCILLAFLVNEVRSLHNVQELSVYCILRSMVALVAVVVVWHRYVSESRYLWVISWWDTTIPFSMGAVECCMVFSINDAKVPLNVFVGTIVFFEIVTLCAYAHSLLRRRADSTQRLYRDFYLGSPQFASHLINFLNNFDAESLKDVLIMTLGSFAVLAVFFIWEGEAREVIFPGVCIATLVVWEITSDFHALLRRDNFLGAYFR